MRNVLREVGQSCAVGVVLSVVVAGPAHAVDGVIEINQARALAGGVSPGDEPGFPVTISQPGSYRLTTNLKPCVPSGGTCAADPNVTVPDANTTAIQITVDNVTIDLNGFAILGSGGAGSGWGIHALIATGGSHTDITVVNGTVAGMSQTGIIVGPNSRVVNVRATSNGVSGISVGEASTVNGNTATANGTTGIHAGSASTVTGNTVKGNGGVGLDVSHRSTVSGNTVNNNGLGIRVGQGSTVTGNTANENGPASTSGIGIAASDGSTVIGNTARFNSSVGLLLLGGGSGYANNVLTGNNGGDANAQVSGGIQMGPNVCGAALCP